MVWWIILLIVLGSLIALLLLAKVYVVCCYNQKNKHWRDWNGKHVVVTGGSAGIGTGTVVHLVMHGASVIFTGRDHTAVKNEVIPEVLEEFRRMADQDKDKFNLRGFESDMSNGKWDAVGNFSSNRLMFRKVDFSDLVEVKKFAEFVVGLNVKIDGLVNNAGGFFAKYRKTKQDLEWTMGVNHYSHFYLTDLLIDTLSEDCRVVNVASHGSKLSLAGALKSPLNCERAFDLKEEGYSGIKGYSLSKLANVLFARGLQEYLDSKNMKAIVSSLHPGSVMTKIWERGGFATVLIVLYPIFWAFFKNRDEGIQTILHCLNAPGFEMEGGAYYVECKVDKSPNPISKNTDDVFNFMQYSKMIVEKATQEKLKRL